jgi:hypothetical protein
MWHKGKSGGLEAIKNKLSGVVSRKRTEISSDAIKDLGVQSLRKLTGGLPEKGLSCSRAHQT